MVTVSALPSSVQRAAAAKAATRKKDEQLGIRAFFLAVPEVE
jgi:hypothetical protein